MNMTRDEWSLYQEALKTGDDFAAAEVIRRSQEAKQDLGKLPVSLVPPAIIRRIAEIRQYGNRKYKDPDNWRDVSAQRHWDAYLRHTLAAWNDLNARDKESGFLHLAHAACDLAFVLQMLEEEENGQDREEEG